jgi:hypothetical protein
MLTMPTISDLFRTVVLGQQPQARTSDARVTPQLQAPASWGSGAALQSIVWADVYGSDYAPMTRAAAMAVPAVARMRNLLVATIAQLPLVDMIGETRTPQQPLWMTRTDGTLSPWHRMAWTVDDCLFYGFSLWAAKRGATTDGAGLLECARVPYESWSIDTEGFIVVGDQRVQSDQAILIPGPHGGLLQDHATIIRLAGDNLQAAANAARNPNPNVNLHYTGDDPDYVPADMIKAWSDARRGLNGGVAYTNKWVEATVMGSHLDKLLIEGRNADAVDIARAGSVPASSLDATNAGASLTYETTEGRNQQFLDTGAKLYMDPIAARLSQDDCVPRGHRTAFDTTAFTTLTPTPTGGPTNE